MFPILSTCLLMLGGLCVGVGRVYNKTNNVLLSAGILFVAAGEQSPTSREAPRGSGGHVLFSSMVQSPDGSGPFCTTLRVLMRDL